MVRNNDIQRKVLKILMDNPQPLSMRRMTHLSDLNYNQIASATSVLLREGYIKRVKSGVYEKTNLAVTFTMCPEEQIRILSKANQELKQQNAELTMRIARILAK